MSKSLKNFVTIQQALQKQTATQLRLAFLLHSWKDTLDYSENTMDMAIQYERLLNEFFLNAKDLTRHLSTASPSKQFDTWSKPEAALQAKFADTKAAVHVALCGKCERLRLGIDLRNIQLIFNRFHSDNIDTRSALDAIRDLVSTTNVAIRDQSGNVNALLLRRIAEYVTELLHVFGAINGPRGGIGFPVGGHSDGNVS